GQIGQSHRSQQEQDRPSHDHGGAGKRRALQDAREERRGEMSAAAIRLTASLLRKDPRLPVYVVIPGRSVGYHDIDRKTRILAQQRCRQPNGGRAHFTATFFASVLKRSPFACTTVIVRWPVLLLLRSVALPDLP